eukprot:1128851_1
MLRFFNTLHVYFPMSAMCGLFRCLSSPCINDSMQHQKKEIDAFHTRRKCSGITPNVIICAGIQTVQTAFISVTILFWYVDITDCNVLALHCLSLSAAWRE